MKKYELELKGERTINAYGECAVQWKSLSAAFRDCEGKKQTAHKLTNISHDKRRRTRIDYIQHGANGQYRYAYAGEVSGKHGGGMTPTQAQAWWQLYIAEHGTATEKENIPVWVKRLQDAKIYLSSVRDNLKRGGYNSRMLISLAKRMEINNVAEKYMSGIDKAAARHILTDYDDHNKKSMSEYEVRELRRQYTNNTIIRVATEPPEE